MMFATKCCLGCLDPRYGARVVAVFDFWIGVILLIKFLSLLNPFYDYEFYIYNTRMEQIPYDFTVFTYLFQIFLFLCINFYLNESTYDYKVHKIYQWLALNMIFLTFHILAVTYITIKNNDCLEILYYSIPICVTHVCQIHVVKCFYDNRMHFEGPTLCSSHASQTANGDGRGGCGNDAGTMAVATSPPMSPPPAYRIQQRVTVEAAAAAQCRPYTHTTTEFQPPALPEQLSRIPDEYYANPPAYSPNYTGPSDSRPI
ncbi:Hypothetical protein CINCED_3A003313 [Cinara cedri]|uniref:Uncharacterized protein n=1 Tax=Cinara cedri TaxID=506608 RepID=A0A5E4NHR7_9HEMI|nr:Hypothetical protein CINCED_3A003313 [Cinara cedri]